MIIDKLHFQAKHAKSNFVYRLRNTPRVIMYAAFEKRIYFFLNTTMFRKTELKQKRDPTNAVRITYLRKIALILCQVLSNM